MPLKVLIVDDNTERNNLISEYLRRLPLLVTSVEDAISAKKQLREVIFDLVILDIALPLRSGEEPNRRGGLDLLAEVLDRGLFKRPKHIVGLTAFSDIYDSAATDFGTELWSVIFYDRGSSAWLDQIEAKARHIIAVEESERQTDGHLVDIIVITALQEPELVAVLNLEWSWKEKPLPADPTQYFEGEYYNKNGIKRKVIAARAPNMGMQAAAILSFKMATLFRPRVVVMCGICAGEKSQVNLGDVIIANPTWDYGSGKHSVKNGERLFEPEPLQCGLSTRVRGIVERAQSKAEMLNTIRDRFPGQKPTTAFKIHMGPLASGAAVLADSEFVKRIQKGNRRLLGIDMEAYGLMAAAAEITTLQPEALVIKGVSDFADETKDDKFRHYSAYASASVLKVLAEELEL